MEPRLVPVTLPRSPSAVDLIEEVWSRGDALLPLPDDQAENGRESLLRLADATLPRGAALVIATSGSTGLPKAVVLSHDAVARAVEMTNAAVGARPGERWLCCLPVSHIAGLMTLLRARALGGPPLVHERFSVEAVAEEEAEYVSVVPTMLRRLLDADADLSRFRRVLVGGAAIPGDLLERARGRGANVSTTYGMSETCGGVVYDGYPLPGVDVRVDEEGRISIASPTLMKGYLGDEAATRRALSEGRFLTSDRGIIEAGRLRVLGRLDDVIVTGGEKVSAREVEEALRAHPEVRDVSVRGEPDPEWGQKVVAIVVSDTLRDTEQLRAHVAARLERQKVPKEFRFADDLPKSV